MLAYFSVARRKRSRRMPLKIFNFKVILKVTVLCFGLLTSREVMWCIMSVMSVCLSVIFVHPVHLHRIRANLVVSATKNS